MFAYDRPMKGYIGDDITVHAYLRDEANEALIPEADITSVVFTIMVPGDDPDLPTIDAQAGTVAGAGHGTLVVSGTTNDAQGNYLGKATFTYTDLDGVTELSRSVPFEYTIEDPFERTNNGGPEDDAVALAWKKLEDCFVPGTRVLMEDGTQKPIEDITVGESVIDAMGDARKVTRLVRRMEDKSIFNIHRRGQGFGRPLKATGNHPLLVIDHSHKNAHLRSLSADSVRDLAEWRRADQLSPGDWVMEITPVLSTSLFSIETSQYVPAPLVFPETTVTPTTFGSRASRPCLIHSGQGRAPAINETAPNTQNRYTAPSYRINWTQDPTHLKGRVLKDGFTLTQITRVEETPYSGPVHCLDVEETHNFIADGIVVHNCFDSELGGPWLRDMTKARFDHSKVRALIDEVMLEINHVMPSTEFTIASFPYDVNDGKAIMAQGLLVATIRHLMRSYTEQPIATNSPVPYFSRERYQQAWSVMYQVELERFQKWLELWKRQFLNLSGAKLLISSRAGRNMQGSMRYRGSLRGF